QPIHCAAVDLAARKIEIRNGWDFLNLNELVTGVWKLTADGKELDRGTIPDLYLKPSDAKVFTVPAKSFVPSPGAEYFVEVAFNLKNKTPWANAGHEVAWDQFKLPDSAPLAISAFNPLDMPSINENPQRIIVTAEDVAARFDLQTGL